MPRITNHSSRRAPPLKDSDFDHEIRLFDNAVDGDGTDGDGDGDTDGDDRSRLAPPPVTVTVASDGGSGSSPSRSTLGTMAPADQPSFRLPPPSPRGRSDLRPEASGGVETAEAVDVLYENERGCFLCGMALFSARALGNLDPSPWTNAANKTSPTDIRTAQVPDPTWQWAWPAWRINHDDGTDEDGWQYSFMFARPFAWHGPTWYSSFVRRRAWTRKRVKRAALSASASAVEAYAAGGDSGDGNGLADPHLLNPDYFVVLPAAEARRSSSRGSRASRGSRGGRGSVGRASRGSRCSMETGQLDGAGADEAADVPDDGFMAMPDVIADADVLMRFLHGARIDREKIEAVDSFLAHAGEDLVRLQDIMHEVMAQFVFQAPRRTLLTHLTVAYDAAVEERDKDAEGGNPALKRRVGYLAAAVRHADEEVRRLEYWSDVKAMAHNGDMVGAVDGSQGWSAARWEGVDASGPAGPPLPLLKKDGEQAEQ